MIECETALVPNLDRAAGGVFKPLVPAGFGGFLLGAWPLRFAADRDGLRCWHFIVGVFTAFPPKIVRSSRRIPLPPVLGAG